MSDQCVESYKRKVGDRWHVGFEFKKCVAVTDENQSEVADQQTWLAVKSAFELLHHAVGADFAKLKSAKWFEAYFVNQPDGGVQLGIDTLAHYKVKPEHNNDKYPVGRQLAWLAVMYAYRFLDYTLTTDDDRPKPVERQGTTDG